MNEQLTEILEIMKSNEETLASAESCTGGKVSGLITETPGISAIYSGGVIAYSAAIKQQLLGVDARIITEKGIVSPETALAMAEGVRKLLNSSWGIATTGYAGPTGGDSRFGVGTVCFAIVCSQRGIAKAWHSKFIGNRESVMHAAATQLLEQLWNEVHHN